MDELSIDTTVEYLRSQPFPLLIWINPLLSDRRTK